MLKDANVRKDFEELNFEAKTAPIWKGSEIIYIDLIFVRIESCFLCGHHYKELSAGIGISIEQKIPLKVLSSI